METRRNGMNFVYDARWLPMLSIQNATDRQAIEGGWVDGVDGVDGERSDPSTPHE